MKPTKAAFRRFIPYVRALANDVGLRDWTIEVIWDSNAPADEIGPDGGPTTLAMCQSMFGRKRAVVTILDQFFERPPEEQKAVLIHELLHCHFGGLQSVIENEVCGLVPPMMWDSFFTNIRRHLETGVDAIAEEIARLATSIPPPSFEPPKRKTS